MFYLALPQDYRDKLRTPESIRAYYLQTPLIDKEFNDKYYHLNPVDILLLLQEYAYRQRNNPRINTKNISLIYDDLNFTSLAAMLKQKHLNPNEDLKLILMVQPGQEFIRSEFEEPRVTQGIHTTPVYLRNIDGVLKVFWHDAGSGVYANANSDGFQKLCQTIYAATAGIYSDVRIIKTSLQAQNDWRTCSVHSLAALKFFCKFGPSLFNEIDQPQNLVEPQHKVSDTDQAYVWHLKFDTTPPRLLKLAHNLDFYNVHPKFKTNPNYLLAQEHLMIKHSCTLVSTCSDMILIEYHKFIKKFNINPFRKCSEYQIRIYQQLLRYNILNCHLEYNHSELVEFLATAVQEGLLNNAGLNCLLAINPVSELAITRGLAFSEISHMANGFAPNTANYAVLAKYNRLPESVQNTRFGKSITPVAYTKLYRDTYFTQDYANTYAQHVTAARHRYVLWSGGFIPGNELGYGLGRIAAERFVVYANKKIATNHWELDQFSTVAMTDIGLPVLNPLWDDIDSPMELKRQITPPYIVNLL